MSFWNRAKPSDRNRAILTPFKYSLNFKIIIIFPINFQYEISRHLNTSPSIII